MSLLLLLLTWQTTPVHGAKVVFGQQRAAYRIQIPSDEFKPVNYRNNGFTQKVTDMGDEALLIVRTHAKPLSTKTVAKVVKPLPQALAPLEEALNQVAGQPLTYQIEILFDWLGRNIEAENEFNPDQSLEKIFNSHRANCVGLSNLALFILEHMGVKARYVTGIAFQPQDPAMLKLEGTVLHRWIEIRYPDIGWVFADPAGKVNHVEARYLVLGIQGLHPLKQYLLALQGSRVELLAFQNGLQVVARQEGMETKLQIRPNRLFVSP